eukprot:Em0002g1015a
MAHTWAIGTECIGKYNFPGSSPHDLPFKKGDILVIVAPSKDPNWYKARREDGLEGMIPYNYVQERATSHPPPPPPVNPSPTAASPVITRHVERTKQSKGEVHIQTMPWFHGKISRETAEKLLTPSKNGMFLVRESQNYRGDYTLCVSYDGKVENYRVQKNEKGLVTVDDDGYFDNLIELVEHYQKDADGLCTRLKQAVDVSGSPPSVVSRKEFEKQGWAIPLQELTKKSLIGKGEFGEFREKRWLIQQT